MSEPTMHLGVAGATSIEDSETSLGLTVVPATNPACCPEPRILMPASNRLVAIEDGDGTVLRRVLRYCAVCRRADLPGVAWRPRVAADESYFDSQAPANGAIAPGGGGRLPAGAPEYRDVAAKMAWADLTLLVTVPAIRSSQLYTEWNARNTTRPMIEKHRRRQFGIKDGGTSKCYVAPIGEVMLGRGLVEHPFHVDPSTGLSKLDEDHLRFGGPTTVETLVAPDEIRLVPAGTDPKDPNSADKHRFFKAFRWSDHIVTTLAITRSAILNGKLVHVAVTSYRLNLEKNPERVDDERSHGDRRGDRLVYTRLGEI